jgi:hypothetical protein
VEYLRTEQGVYGDISLKILPSLSTISSSSPGILDVSSSPLYWYPRVSRAISGYTLLFMKLKAPQPGLSKGLNLLPSCIIGSVFRHGLCFDCFLGFGSSGWWLLM